VVVVVVLLGIDVVVEDVVPGRAVPRGKPYSFRDPSGVVT